MTIANYTGQGIGTHVALSIEKDCVGFNECRYHKSLTNLDEFDSISTVIIPWEIGDTTYTIEEFIKHIRLSEREDIANAQIKVVADDLDKATDYDFNNNLSWGFLEKLGVGLQSKDNFEIVSSKGIVKSKVNSYRNDINKLSRLRSGRHDQANAWGAFSLLYSLKLALTGYDKEVLTLKNRLFEDVYFKSKYWSLFLKDKEYPDLQYLLKKLKSQKSEWNALVSKHDKFSILIVEDQLDDGWECAYKIALKDGVKSVVNLNFVKTLEEAKRADKSGIDLVILDVRLDKDRVELDQDADPLDYSSLSGVKFSHILREDLATRTVPIIAATASNKVWTLSALLDYGINEYWVKESPDICEHPSHAIQNAIDFFTKIIATVTWSLNTRAWVDDIYSITEKMKAQDQADHVVAKMAQSKAKSFHALIHQSANSYSNKIDGGLQLNLAFLVAFSLYIELMEWLCTVNGSGNFRTWSYQKRKLLTLEQDRGKLRFRFTQLMIDAHVSSVDSSDDFPDIPVFNFIIKDSDLDPQVFKNMTALRNKLPSTHGKLPQYNKKEEEASDIKSEDISNLIKFYKELVDKIM